MGDHSRYLGGLWHLLGEHQDLEAADEAEDEEGTGHIATKTVINLLGVLRRQGEVGWIEGGPQEPQRKNGGGSEGTPVNGVEGNWGNLGDRIEGNRRTPRDAGNGMQGGDPRGWEGTGGTPGDGMEGMRLRR